MMNFKNLASKIDKKVILSNLPYLMFFWMGNKMSYSCRHNSNFLLGIVEGIRDLLKAPYISFYIIDVLIGVIVAIAASNTALPVGVSLKM